MANEPQVTGVTVGEGPNLGQFPAPMLESVTAGEGPNLGQFPAPLIESITAGTRVDEDAPLLDLAFFAAELEYGYDEQFVGVGHFAAEMESYPTPWLQGAQLELEWGSVKPPQLMGTQLELAWGSVKPPQFVGVQLEFQEVLEAPPPDIDSVDCTQDTGVSKGRSKVKLYWTSGGGATDKFSLYRLPGNMPVAEDSSRTTVVNFEGCVTVEEDIAGTETEYEETMTDAENGETWTYYLFAKNAGGAYSTTGDAIMIETLTGIPQTVRIADIGDRKVRIAWDSVGDVNVNGVNIFRCEGDTFNPATAVQLNSSLVTGTTFLDSAENVTNRRPVGEVEAPRNGQKYSYKVESEDTSTAWTTGTQNQSYDPLKSAVTTASKDDD